MYRDIVNSICYPTGFYKYMKERDDLNAGAGENKV